MDSMCNLCMIMAVVPCVNLRSSKDSLAMHLLQASTKFCFEVQAAISLASRIKLLTPFLEEIGHYLTTGQAS